jgi:hypothetical protein
MVDIVEGLLVILVCVSLWFDVRSKFFLIFLLLRLFLLAFNNGSLARNQFFFLINKFFTTLITLFLGLNNVGIKLFHNSVLFNLLCSSVGRLILKLYFFSLYTEFQLLSLMNLSMVTFNRSNLSANLSFTCKNFLQQLLISKTHSFKFQLLLLLLLF